MRQEKPSASTTASGPAFAYGGQQVVLGDLHRDLVVAVLDPEVARQPAAAADPLTVGPGLASRAASVSQPMTAWWWQCGWATTSTPVRSGGVHSPGHAVGEELRERVDSRAHLGGAGVVDQLAGVLPERGEAARLEADDRGAARRRTPCSVSTACADDPPRGGELAGGDPGQPAARRARGSPPPAGPPISSSSDRRPAGVRGEAVGERVGPDPDVDVAPRSGVAVRVAQRASPRTAAGCAAGRPRPRTWRPGRPSCCGASRWPASAASSWPSAAAGRARSGSAACAALRRYFCDSASDL